jgi:hypothetical protein
MQRNVSYPINLKTELFYFYLIMIHFICGKCRNSRNNKNNKNNTHLPVYYQQKSETKRYLYNTKPYTLFTIHFYKTSMLFFINFFTSKFTLTNFFVFSVYDHYFYFVLNFLFYCSKFSTRSPFIWKSDLTLNVKFQSIIEWIWVKIGVLNFL